MVDELELLQLVELAQTGDRQAFGVLARQFESTIFAIALRRLRNRTEAAELTQDVLVQAMRKLPQLREPERFAGWLRRITVRMAINRVVRRPKETISNPEIFGNIRGEGRSPLEHILKGEAAGEVKAGLRKLRALDRATLLAFYFEGQSLIEMSQQFQSPVGTIKRRLHTARNRLKDVLTHLQPA
ncbi:ECF RNA polymerase sigma factor SigW [Planctopirus ephydatiae]|jgi:RNA polymerase sigma-70 factor (ECF subfamily)|uniref:ECF RNA polymerase sigma factor SigW n=1 Tax=Planctopirus ephydatiae TaxID=2528019 RepID=A0A518GMA2_9PLAN|nr:sigma-70 family RNA polymerase sigma factor [Planctopirus ephydatiae]QDV29571.1 ECF RNA polymerase sigma factor SigW [Planctopirus ephydatiae]